MAGVPPIPSIPHAGLYAIVDVDAVLGRGLDVERVAHAIVRGGPAVIQVRAKSSSARETLAWLRALRGLTREANILLFANDRADLAALADADGVHLGQSDVPLGDVLRAFSGLRVGISTHDAFQLENALRARPDYIAFGPVFSTASKRNPEPTVGIEALCRARMRAREEALPLVAIGGLDRRRLSTIAELGIMGAVISALLPEQRDDDPYQAIERRTAELAELFRSDEGG